MAKKPVQEFDLIRKQAQELINDESLLPSDSVKFAAWKARLDNTLDKYAPLCGTYKNAIECVEYAQRFARFGDGKEALRASDYRKNSIRKVIMFLDLIIESIQEEELESIEQKRLSAIEAENKVFIVHGRDEKTKAQVQLLLAEQGIEYTVLSEDANEGRTIIEKLEAHINHSAAIILMTGDDEGRLCGNSKLTPRARQNVIFEAGLFTGVLGRNRVVFLVDPEIEIPNDLSGIGYTNFNQNWKTSVLNELRAMGFEIDMNKLRCGS